MSLFRFPKTARIRARFEFLRLQQKGNFYSGRYLQFQWNKSVQASGSRLGVTVTKKYGNAVERNHIKRLLREAFRLRSKNEPVSLDVNIKPKSAAKKGSLQDFQEELELFFRSADISR